MLLTYRCEDQGSRCLIIIMMMIMIMMVTGTVIVIMIMITDTEELFIMSDGTVFQSVGGCYRKRSCTICLQIKMRNNDSPE